MNRILISAVIAIGFHIALMVFMPSLLKKKEEILPQKIKSVMVTLSYRQPVIKKKIPSTNQIEKIKPPPKFQNPIPFPLKKKVRHILKKKNLAKLQKKRKQNQPVIHRQKKEIKRMLNAVKTAPATAEVAETIRIKTKQPPEGSFATVKKINPQKKENINRQEGHIEFAKPLYKKNTLPSYPLLAKRRGYIGTVELLVLVSEEGKVSSLKIFKSSGHGSLDRQAVKTVKGWLFEPGKKNGIPREMWVKIPVKFEIK